MQTLQCDRFVWQLDWDRLRYTIWFGTCDCPASRDCRAQSTALPNIHRASESRHQSEIVRRFFDFRVQWIQSCAHLACAPIPRYDLDSTRLHTGSIIQGTTHFTFSFPLNSIVWMISRRLSRWRPPTVHTAIRPATISARSANKTTNKYLCRKLFQTRTNCTFA